MQTQFAFSSRFVSSPLILPSQMSDPAGRPASMSAPQSTALTAADQFVSVRFGGGEPVSKADMLGKQMMDAIEEGHMDLVPGYIEQGANVNYSDGSRCPLTEVIRAENDALFHLLIEKKANPDPDEDTSYDIPLGLALKQNRLDYAKTLIDNGANVGRGARYGGAPIVLSAPESLIDLILANGFDMNARANGQSMLMCAVRAQNPAWVKRFLAAGQNVNEVHQPTDGSWPTGAGGYGNIKFQPLQFAAEGGDPTIIQLLIDAGADQLVGSQQEVSYHRDTPLSVAAKNGNVEAVGLLMDNLDKLDMPVEKRQEIKDGAMIDALLHAQTEVVDALLARKVGTTDAGKPKPTLLFEAMSSSNNSEKMVTHLIQKGIDVNEGRNANNQTPLIRAADHHREKLVQLLLDAGASVTARDKRGWTALMYVRDYSGISRRQNHRKEHFKKASDLLEAKGAKLSMLDKAKLFKKQWSPFSVIGRGLDNVFGGIHW